MVRIDATGNIIREDANSSAAARRGNLASASQTSASCPAGGRGPMPSGHPSGQNTSSGSAGPSGPGLVAQLEEKLGLVGKKWSTPEVPSLHWASIDIPLVNLVLAAVVGLLMLTMGYSATRVAVFAALALAVYIQFHNASSRPNERGHAAREERRGTGFGNSGSVGRR
jgi:hypothetical protein